MQINLIITDDGNGININSDNGAIVSSGQNFRASSLPESWWSEARQTYIHLQDALARDDMAAVRATENWIGGMLKAATLIFPNLDHTELMTEVMVSIQPSGPSWEGIGQIVKETPLPSQPNEGAGERAKPVIRTSQPTRRVLVGSDFDELGPIENEINYDENSDSNKDVIELKNSL